MAFEAQIASIDTALAGYAATLATESTTPLESYTTPDGEQTTANEWREGIARTMDLLMKQRAFLMQLNNQLNPYFVSTRHVV